MGFVVCIMHRWNLQKWYILYYSMMRAFDINGCDDDHDDHNNNKHDHDHNHHRIGSYYVCMHACAVFIDDASVFCGSYYVHAFVLGLCMHWRCLYVLWLILCACIDDASVFCGSYSGVGLQLLHPNNWAIYCKNYLLHPIIALAIIAKPYCIKEGLCNYCKSHRSNNCTLLQFFYLFLTRF